MKAKALGDILKQARLDKRLSLQDIKNETKIRQNHLKAIEEGDLHKLPGPVYAKGFIMNYARVVGLNEQAVLEKYYALKKEAEGKREEDEGERIPADEGGPVGAADQSGRVDFSARRSLKLLQREKRPSLRAGSFIKALVIGLIIAAVIIGLLFFYRQTVDSSTTGELIPEETTRAVEDSQEAGEKGQMDAENSVNEGKEAAAERRAPVEKEEPPVLKAEANATVWIGLYTKDTGRIIYEGTLGPQSVREWILTGPVRMRMGNAGGVNLFFRGEDLGTQGKEGEVKTLEFSLDQDGD